MFVHLIENRIKTNRNWGLSDKLNESLNRDQVQLSEIQWQVLLCLLCYSLYTPMLPDIILYMMIACIITLLYALNRLFTAVIHFNGNLNIVFYDACYVSSVEMSE